MKRLLHYIFTNKKHEKLILGLLLGCSLLLGLGVLVPQIVMVARLPENGLSNSSPIPVSAAEAPVTDLADSITTTAPVSSPEVASSEKSGADEDSASEIPVHLTALSIENDLYLFARDSKEEIISGIEFPLTVTYPDGQTGTFTTGTDGCCYLVSLTAGAYQAKVDSCPPYVSSGESVSCEVKSSASCEKIDNVEEIVEIRDLTEGLEEIKTNDTTLSDSVTVIDYITSDAITSDLSVTDTGSIPVTGEAETSALSTVDDSSNGSSSSGSYVYDSRGNLTYRYTYHMDDSGYLVDRNNSSTDVLPNIENGVLVCGFRFNNDTKTYETVTLFHDDNTPLEEYWIDAEPVLAESATPEGWQTEGSELVYYANGNKLTGLKNIDGKLYFFESSGHCAEHVGIDVSFYNGNINWNAVKNAGIEFAVIRIGFRGWGSGAIYQDTCFAQNLRNAKAAGIRVGVYFYSTAVNRVEAIEEASICLEWLNGASLDYPVFLDMEFSGDYPEGRQDQLSSALRSEIAQAFCDTITNAGYTSGVYATQSFLTDEIDYSSISRYQIWMASFTDNYAVPVVSTRYDIWQFTDFGKVAGVNGTVDFSVIF